MLSRCFGLAVLAFGDVAGTVPGTALFGEGQDHLKQHHYTFYVVNGQLP